MAIRIEALYIYPVKSLGGVALNEASADIRGLADDRRWMLVDDNGRFITQRQIPALATIQPALTKEHLTLQRGDARITIARQTPDSPLEPAQIWSDPVEVRAETDEVTEFLAHCLPDAPRLRLVQLAARRPQSKPHYLGHDTHTVFADMAPMLVANSASLQALNDALLAKGEEPVPMNRFRPNVVISGVRPFAEHRLKGLKNAHYQLRFGYPCERCVVTTIDQLRGLKHPHMEPYVTLRDLNSMPAYGEGEFAKPANPKAPAFGENTWLSAPDRARLLVGDILRVL